MPLCPSSYFTALIFKSVRLERGPAPTPNLTNILVSVTFGMDDPAAKDSEGEQHVPLVRYGQHNYQIPGDPYGLKTAHSGNVAHIEDESRVDVSLLYLQRSTSISSCPADVTT